MGRKPKPKAEKNWVAPANVRRPAVLKLKLAGYTPEEIGVKLRLTPTTVRGDIAAIMATVGTESPAVAELRIEQGMRLEYLWKALHTATEAGDVKGISVAMKVLERQAKLFGLDADQKSQIQVSPTGDWDRILCAAPTLNAPRAMGLPAGYDDDDA
jgi:hypothetical protein